jgi:hypothetical protein
MEEYQLDFSNDYWVIDGYMTFKLTQDHLNKILGHLGLYRNNERVHISRSNKW